MILVIILALLGIASAAHKDISAAHHNAYAAHHDKDVETEFADWQALQGKSYKTLEERNFRLKIFAKSRAFVNAFNADPKNGHTVALNLFADWTDDEYSQLLGYRRPDG